VQQALDAGEDEVSLCEEEVSGVCVVLDEHVRGVRVRDGVGADPSEYPNDEQRIGVLRSGFRVARVWHSLLEVSSLRSCEREALVGRAGVIPPREQVTWV